jgi:mannosyltransferase OCH1-like enzyme
MYNKNIFHVYHEKKYKDCPEIVKDNIESWKTINPSWNHVYVSIQDGIKEMYDQYGKDGVRAINSIKTRAGKSDVIRYFLLNSHGGVYSDVDAFCVQPIENWVHPKFNIVCGSMESAKFLQISPIFSTPDNKILDNLIEGIIENILSKKYNHYPQKTMGLTGPFAFTREVMDFYGIEDQTLFSNVEFEKNGMYLFCPRVDSLFNGDYIRQIFFSRTSIQGYESWMKKSGETDEMNSLNTDEMFYKYWRNIK